jgi:uncharacterized membrane protein
VCKNAAPLKTNNKDQQITLTVKLKIAQFIIVMLFALIAGVFWGTWFALSRSVASIDPGTFITIGKITISNLALGMGILMSVTALISLGMLYVLFKKRSAPFYLTLSGFLCLIAVLLITLLVNVPIDNQIKNWTVQTLPTDWQDIRDRWELFHTLRTFISLASLGLVLAAALWQEKSFKF